jgi:hypothetical protein
MENNTNKNIERKFEKDSEKKWLPIKPELLKKILWGIGILFAVLVIFNAGVFVGYKKASFSYGFGDNYYRAFGRDRNKPLQRPPFFENFPISHGATGEILKINIPYLIMESPEGIEKIIKMSNGTKIRYMREEIKQSDIKTGDFAVVIGNPNEKSEIEASFIRLLPPPPEFIKATSTKQK